MCFTFGNKMRTSQIIASIALAGLWTVLAAIVLNGGFMTGFGPSGPPDPQSITESGYPIRWTVVIINILTTLVFALPIMSLWMRYEAMIIVGAVAIIPLFIAGLIALSILPLGILILTVVFIWSHAARSRWNFLKSLQPE